MQEKEAFSSWQLFCFTCQISIVCFYQHQAAPEFAHFSIFMVLGNTFSPALDSRRCSFLPSEYFKGTAFPAPDFSTIDFLQHSAASDLSFLPGCFTQQQEAAPICQQIYMTFPLVTSQWNATVFISHGQTCQHFYR